MTENQLRQKVADIINGWVGATRGSAKHLEILEIYNTHKPLARGYKVQVQDAHCATTTSAAYIKAGIAEYTGTECGVEKYTEVAKKLGIWVENDAHTPKVGDAVVYDWDDNGVGDCTGYGDHVGIVTAINGTAMVITEGNMSGGKVGTRALQVNAKYIRGYICPNFAAIAKKLGDTGAAEEPAKPATATAFSHTVVRGDTLGKIAAKYGTTVAALAEINGIRNVNLISVGQVIHLTEVAAATAKLTKLGVINSPDYWNGVAASGVVEYLGTLLVSAADKLTKTGTRANTVQEGVDALVAAGIINTPAYWLANQDKAASLGLLLRALGGAAAAGKPAKPAAKTYTVARGDTLGKIAAKYGTTVAKLAAANGIRNVNLIHVGQVLTIPE